MKNFLVEKGLDFSQYTRDEHIMLNHLFYITDSETHQFTTEEKVNLMTRMMKHSITSGVILHTLDFRMIMSTMKKMKLVSQIIIMNCFYNVHPDEFKVDDIIELVNDLKKKYPLVKVSEMKTEDIEIDL